MATLMEVLKNMLGEKANEEISTDSSTVEQPQPTEQTQPPGNTPPTAPSPDTAKITALEAEIAKLKKDNQALLTKTSVVEGEQKSVDELIMGICMPEYFASKK